jgi:hypothetical protein
MKTLVNRTLDYLTASCIAEGGDGWCVWYIKTHSDRTEEIKQYVTEWIDATPDKFWYLEEKEWGDLHLQSTLSSE